jgi:hypothetical protein
MFKVLRNLFSGQVHATIKEWALDACRTLEEVDPVFNRTFIHNPKFLIDVHHQLESFASDIFGEDVKKSYCFLSNYGDGAVCPMHVDRPQCKWTIDYLIDQNHDEPWPLFVSETYEDNEQLGPFDAANFENLIKKHNWSSALLYPNDAACYSGTNQIHFRNKAPLNHSSKLVFFHFVPKGFNGSLD